MDIFTTHNNSYGNVIFSQVSVCPQGGCVSQHEMGRGGVYPSIQWSDDICPAAVCRVGSVQEEVSVKGVSVKGVSVQGGVCPGGCLPRRVSAQEGVCQGGCLPHTT